MEIMLGLLALFIFYIIIGVIISKSSLAIYSKIINYLKKLFKITEEK